MSPDQLTVYILFVVFCAYTFHVALDNTLALIRWVRQSRISVTYRYRSPHTLVGKLAHK